MLEYWSDRKARIAFRIRSLPFSETHHSNTPLLHHSKPILQYSSLHHSISTPLRLRRRRDVAFTETVKSHRIVVEHFSFEFIGKIFPRL